MDVPRQPQYKIVMIGDYGVGKTSLLKQYLNKGFPTDHKPSVTADYETREVEVDGKKVNLKIWDTAGMEKFDTLGPIYYRETDCCVLVYDTTNEKSFKSLDKWRKEFLIIREPEQVNTFPFVVIGTKADKKTERKVDKAEVEAWYRGWWKKEGEIPLYEISAIQTEVVKQVFKIIAKAAMNQPGWVQGIVLSAPQPKVKFNCC